MKSKKLMLTAHCILNQNSVIEGWARARGAFPITNLLINQGIGILQLPCPELLFKGIGRPPLEYRDYDTDAYRELCRTLLYPYLIQVKNYLENGYQLLGIIAVHQSPSCSVTGQQGVFMEELFSLFKEQNISLNYLEIPENYNETTSAKELEEQLTVLVGGETI